MNFIKFFTQIFLPAIRPMYIHCPPEYTHSFSRIPSISEFVMMPETVLEPAGKITVEEENERLKKELAEAHEEIKRLKLANRYRFREENSEGCGSGSGLGGHF